MLWALNENIRRLRIQHGLSQVEFATKMGVTKQCASNWENDNVLPSIEMLSKIADYFKVSTDFLLGRNVHCTIDASGLTEEQYAHIAMLVRDFESLNEAVGGEVKQSVKQADGHRQDNVGGA